MTAAYAFSSENVPASGWLTRTSSSTRSLVGTPVTTEDPGQTARYFTLIAQSRLRAIAELPNNWDSCGSPAPRREAVSNASTRLSELFRVVSTVGGWREPHVSASETGDIIFEWRRQHRKVTLYIGDVRMEVVKSWGANIRHEMDVVDLPNTAEFAPIWEWLNDGQ